MNSYGSGSRPGWTIHASPVPSLLYAAHTPSAKPYEPSDLTAIEWMSSEGVCSERTWPRAALAAEAADDAFGVLGGGVGVVDGRGARVV